MATQAGKPPHDDPPSEDLEEIVLDVVAEDDLSVPPEFRGCRVVELRTEHGSLILYKGKDGFTATESQANILIQAYRLEQEAARAEREAQEARRQAGWETVQPGDLVVRKLGYGPDVPEKLQGSRLIKRGEDYFYLTLDGDAIPKDVGDSLLEAWAAERGTEGEAPSQPPDVETGSGPVETDAPGAFVPAGDGLETVPAAPLSQPGQEDDEVVFADEDEEDSETPTVLEADKDLQEKMRQLVAQQATPERPRGPRGEGTPSEPGPAPNATDSSQAPEAPPGPRGPSRPAPASGSTSPPAGKVEPSGPAAKPDSEDLARGDEPASVEYTEAQIAEYAQELNRLGHLLRKDVATGVLKASDILIGPEELEALFWHAVETPGPSEVLERYVRRSLEIRDALLPHWKTSQRRQEQSWARDLEQGTLVLMGINPRQAPKVDLAGLLSLVWLRGQRESAGPKLRRSLRKLHDALSAQVVQILKSKSTVADLVAAGRLGMESGRPLTKVVQDWVRSTLLGSIRAALDEFAAQEGIRVPGLDETLAVAHAPAVMQLTERLCPNGAP